MIAPLRTSQIKCVCRKLLPTSEATAAYEGNSSPSWFVSKVATRAVEIQEAGPRSWTSLIDSIGMSFNFMEKVRSDCNCRCRCDAINQSAPEEVNSARSIHFSAGPISRANQEEEESKSFIDQPSEVKSGSLLFYYVTINMQQGEHTKRITLLSSSN